jgi:hypothetical protein
MTSAVKSLVTAILSLVFLITFSPLHGEQGVDDVARVRHVILISVDGMHALDLAQYVANNPNSTLAELTKHAVNYTNASTTKPSDSLPATVGMMTGGTPAVAGVYYDDAWHRKLSPPGSNCTTLGAVIDLKEGIDKDPAALDGGGGLDPAKLPRDPSKGCTPVYPHDLVRVNTIFEVIKAAGMHTAYSEKRPSYDILNGPSGKGVNDLYTPEIAFDNTLRDNTKTIAFDELRVASILNEIDGKDHSGTKSAPIPAIFGMNFQCVNAAKKNAPGGYADSFSTPSATLQAALDYVDASLGRMVARLKMRNIADRTAIIVTAKHGETALDPNRRVIVLNSVIPNIINGVQAGLAARVTQKANAFIWLKDQSKTAAVVQALTTPVNQNAAGIGQVLSGTSLKLMFPDPLSDPTVPDIMVIANTGVNYEPSLSSTVLAEHGGFGENDNHVPLMVFVPEMDAITVRTQVQTTQIAPTVLRLLKLNPAKLQAVQLEGTEVLPGIPVTGN